MSIIFFVSLLTFKNTFLPNNSKRMCLCFDATDSVLWEGTGNYLPQLAVLPQAQTLDQR